MMSCTNFDPKASASMSSENVVVGQFFSNHHFKIIGVRESYSH